MTDYGNGIHTGKEVFTNDETKVINNAKVESERLEKISSELTGVSNSFDDVILKVHNFSMNHNIKDTISRPILQEIQKIRANYIRQVKDELLSSE